MLPKLTFVLGGASSGKTGFAERLVLKQQAQPVYIATAQVFDDEMQAKVDAHRHSRGDGWHTVEAPLALAEALADCTAGQTVLIDCATLWLTNLMLADQDITAATGGLIDAIRDCPARVVIVSNEVGQGIVPDNRLGRRFRDAQGKLNQLLAAEADLAVLVVAGLPQVLKGDLPCAG